MKTTVGVIVVFVLVGTVFGVESVSLSVTPVVGEKQSRPATPGVAPETCEVLVLLVPGTDVQQFAQAHGLTFKYALQSNQDACVFEASSPSAAEAFVAGAGSNASVQSAYLNVRTQAVMMSFVPDDPYFPKDQPSAGWPGQWHLVNQHVAGRDVGVQGAWNRDITGSGVVIGFVDDSLQTTHPDLSPNYDAANSWDFGQNDGNPDPVHSDDDHGTVVAGIAAARGGNGVGVTGAAPYASIAGLRVDFNNQTTAQFVDATLYHSSGDNTDIKVKNHSYGMRYTYVPAQAEVDALETSVDCGTIHTLSAGNGREGGWDIYGAYARDSNKMHLQSSPAAITVAALGSDGKFAYYSSFGANVFVTAPSGTTGGFWITTTDRTGSAGYNTGSGDTFPDDNYTSIFGGTSASSPEVAGVMALGKEVQPNLNTRFAKHLLVKTCKKVDLTDSTEESDGGWKTNAAGNSFNQNYGFGLIDADAFTKAAVKYSGVTPLTTETTGLVDMGHYPLPDRVGDCVTFVYTTFTMTSTTPLEEVLLTLDIEHTWRGDLEAYLISPENGTTCRMMMENVFDSDEDIDWTFLTNAFWGENPAGEWTVGVMDVWEEDTGYWNSFEVEIRMGELVPIPEPGTWALVGTGALLVFGIVRRRRMRNR